MDVFTAFKKATQAHARRVKEEWPRLWRIVEEQILDGEEEAFVHVCSDETGFCTALRQLGYRMEQATAGKSYPCDEVWKRLKAIHGEDPEEDIFVDDCKRYKIELRKLRTQRGR